MVFLVGGQDPGWLRAYEGLGAGGWACSELEPREAVVTVGCVCVCVCARVCVFVDVCQEKVLGQVPPGPPG